MQRLNQSILNIELDVDEPLDFRDPGNLADQINLSISRLAYAYTMYRTLHYFARGGPIADKAAQIPGVRLQAFHCPDPENDETGLLPRPLNPRDLKENFRALVEFTRDVLEKRNVDLNAHLFEEEEPLDVDADGYIEEFERLKKKIPPGTPSADLLYKFSEFVLRICIIEGWGGWILRNCAAFAQCPDPEALPHAYKSLQQFRIPLHLRFGIMGRTKYGTLAAHVRNSLHIYTDPTEQAKIPGYTPELYERHRPYLKELEQAALKIRPVIRPAIGDAISRFTERVADRIDALRGR